VRAAVPIPAPRARVARRRFAPISPWHRLLLVGCHAATTSVYSQRMDLDGVQARVAGNGKVEVTERGWRLHVPPGNDGSYRLAQIDDHAGRSRNEFAWRPPVTLSLRARVSGSAIRGTWGFGFWNDPFGLACGPTKEFLRLPALPQAAWFFSASERSYLSLRGDMPANGFFAQVFRSAGVGAWLLGAGLTFPLAPRRARLQLSRRLAEQAARVSSDPQVWHRYELRWHDSTTDFSIDGQEMLRSRISPKPPLGTVIWIDNQYAAFDPQGHLAWGLESDREGTSLEIEDLTCRGTSVR